MKILCLGLMHRRLKLERRLRLCARAQHHRWMRLTPRQLEQPSLLPRFRKPQTPTQRSPHNLPQQSWREGQLQRSRGGRLAPQ